MSKTSQRRFYGPEVTKTKVTRRKTGRRIELTDADGMPLLTKKGKVRTRAEVKVTREVIVLNIVRGGGVSLHSSERAVSDYGAMRYERAKVVSYDARENKRHREAEYRALHTPTRDYPKELRPLVTRKPISKGEKRRQRKATEV